MAIVAGCLAITGSEPLPAQETRREHTWPKAATEPYPVKTDMGSLGSELRGAIERYTEDRALLDRSYAVQLSPARHARLRSFLDDWLGALQQFDFERLSQQGKIDYLLLSNHLQTELRRLSLYEKSLAEMESLIPFASVVVELAERRRWAKPIDARAAAAALNRLRQQVAGVRVRLEKRVRRDGGVSDRERVLAERAERAVHELRDVLEEWYTFYHGYHPLFTWWTTRPYEAAQAALEGYADFLRQTIIDVEPGAQDPIIANPAGRELLMSELAHEMIPYSIEELLAIAQQQLAWTQAELRRASRELGFGDNWRRAVDHVKNLHPEPGAQANTVRMLALEAIEFIRARDLVTIPDLAVESWRLDMRPPEDQTSAAFFTGGETITMSYPTDTQDHGFKIGTMRGNNLHFSRATVHHELIPGHHLQGFMERRYRSYRRLFRTPFLGEGWAFYWELLLWDLGFPKGPEDRIGFLVWRQHRAGRIIFTMNLHLGKWTPEQCIDFMVNEIGHERSSATSEVRGPARGVNPLYQSSYMLGALQLRALHRELVDSGQMTNKAFHDAVLRAGSIPIEMIRASLTNQPLARDHEPSWRFYGDPRSRNGGL